MGTTTNAATNDATDRSRMYVVTADQKSSRTTPDAVPELLAHLAHLSARPLLAFERTAGDEVQALFDDPRAVVDAVVELIRADRWWIGVGIGDVDRPLPTASARAGRGPAYLAARTAVERAKTVPAGLAIDGEGESAQRAETAAWLLAALLSRRSAEGWEVVDLMAVGTRQVDVAAKLGVSPQAVSRRLRVAGWTEERRGRDLLTWLLGPGGGPRT